MWNERIQELQSLRERAELGGGMERIEKQHSAGKMTARERIACLLDEDSFVEINAFVESRINDFGLESRRVPGDGVVTGYGKIDGRLVFVMAEDFTVIGGTLGEYHSWKICQLQDMALNMMAPIIMINDSGGARIEEGICSLSGYSGMFLRNTRASGVIPQISVIMGPCSGGACYSPAICDFIFMVKGTGNMFITGPKVVKTVINEEATIEELGGADICHTKSGVAHFVYETEQECLSGVRQLLYYLPDNNKKIHQQDLEHGVHQRDHSRKLQQIVPGNSKKPYDVKKVIKVIVDRGSFFEVQEGFAKNVVIGFARMDGKVTGIIANQPSVLSGSLDCDGSDKMARFIRFCDCFSIPLVTLIDVPAFFPGTEQEHRGIIRHGAKILYAYSEATVPKISLIMRKAYGGAYIAMNSKNMGADIVYAWPIAEIAVMGAEGAVNIVFKKQIKSAADSKKEETRLRKEYEDTFMNPYIAAKRGYVDEIIRPDETRQKLLAALAMLRDKELQQPWKKHGNIPL